jgi:hypothetical protein
MMRRMTNIRLIAAVFMSIALSLLLHCLSFAGSLEPSDPPGPTMKTLDQIPPTWSIKLPASERFVVLSDFNNEAVLDKETGLVWQKDLNPNPLYPHDNWRAAHHYCNNLVLGGRMGWRLPTVQEMTSLIDPTQTNPALPSGHPFTNVWPRSNPWYWTATTYLYDVYAWSVYTWDDGSAIYAVDLTSKEQPYGLKWCVRGGQGVDNQ